MTTVIDCRKVATTHVAACASLYSSKQEGCGDRYNTVSLAYCVLYVAVADAGDFVCGRCSRAKASQQVVSHCGATLIVCPASILHQWQSEITKHTQPGALKVITYLGQLKTSLDSPAAAPEQLPDGNPSKLPSSSTAVGPGDKSKGRAGRKGKYSGQGVVSAEDLAAADVVLTTYDVLKRDVHQQADPDQQTKTFRTRKRYEVAATASYHKAP